MVKRLFLITIFIVSVSFINQSKKERLWIPIHWVDNIAQDFSFKDNWSYPDGVFKNKFGQPSCDSGICHGIKDMKDKNGRIIKDSLEAFYKIVDTTHIKHSLKSSVNMYEVFRANFINFNRSPNGTIVGKSLTNMATHSSLNIKIQNDSAKVWVDFNSIKNVEKLRFHLKEGSIMIDKSYFEKGIIKADFNFTFLNTLEEYKNLSWKGLIFSEINIQ